MPSRDRVVPALLLPQRCLSQTPIEWDLLIRQARRANLLARLASALKRQDLIEDVPEAPRVHLQAALCVAERQALSVRWELQCLAKAFANTGIPLIVLKGAAYLAAGLDASVGRVFSDIDLIVPRAQIVDAESALMQNGWKGADLSSYDQRYYRQWMHEVPPMTHVRRGTTVDLHHSILPPTARIKVRTQPLLDSAIEVGQGVKVLAPVDMVLHSATHLFHEGEFDNGLRDLFDLDHLLRHFAAQLPGFWDALVPRAVELGLTRPLYYALRYTSRLLGTPVPHATAQASRVGRPDVIACAVMDACYRRALQPMHPSTDGRAARLARFVLYVRSHWIRMPWPLLARHLGRKACLRLLQRPSREPSNAMPADRP